MTKEESFKEFINNNLDRSYAFAYTLTKNAQDAEDIVHDSVIKSMKNIESLKDIDKVKSWFYKIISNSAFTMLNRKKKIVYIDENILNESIEDKVDFDGDLDFEKMIEVLPAELRAIIVLKFFEDMTTKEIAIILDINENTVKSRLYRALGLLKTEVEDSHEQKRN